jgi:prefoldin subunit 5
LQIALQHQNIRGQIQHFQKEENAQATKAFRPATDQLKTAKKAQKYGERTKLTPVIKT